MKNWIRVKRIAPRRDDQGRLPTEKQLSYLISRKISEEGTKGTGIYEKANALTYQEWNAEIDKAIQKDLELNLEAIIKTLNQKTNTRRRR